MLVEPLPEKDEYAVDDEVGPALLPHCLIIAPEAGEPTNWFFKLLKVTVPETLVDAL